MAREKRILVVDDEERMCRNLKRILESENYRVETALDGISGIQKLKKSKYHLVITDLRMPKGGFEILSYLKSRVKQTPVIVMTGFSKEYNEEECLQWGVAQYFPKPFEPQDMVDSVKNILGRKK